MLRRGQTRGAEPTIATFLPVRAFGSFGRIQPSEILVSTMFFSICLIVTRLVIPNTLRSFARRQDKFVRKFRKIIGRVQLPQASFHLPL